MASVKVGRDVQGKDYSTTGFIGAEGKMGSVTLGGNLLGGDNFNNGLIEDTGSIRGLRLGSVTIGGSVQAGIYTNPDNSGGDVLSRSGSISASEDIGSVVIKGSLLGNHTYFATISAGSLAGNPVNNNLVIKSVKIGGDVDRGWIRAGVNLQGGALNGNAQIGAVTVGGNWIASSMTAGVNAPDGEVGDGDDTIIGGGTLSKIASITITGKVLGANNDETFGFAAKHIGAFKYSGKTVALTPGAGNDTFPAAKAVALGSSRTSETTDGFAVHVYEI